MSSDEKRIYLELASPLVSSPRCSTSRGADPVYSTMQSLVPPLVGIIKGPVVQKINGATAHAPL